MPKDGAIGPFVDEWRKTFEENCKDVEEVDVSVALSTYCLSTKDEIELRAMRTSSKACVAVMNPFFLEEMSNVLDEEKKVKHSTLSDKIDRVLDDAGWWKAVTLPGGGKLPSDLDLEQLDWAQVPVVQSGGRYDLKPSARANDDNLHAGVIIAAMGLRYKQYTSSIARTYLVDPNKPQESNYKVLYGVHKLVLSELRDGVTARDVYAKALAMVRTKKPDLEKHFVKNVGAGIGLEKRDQTLLLNSKCSRTLKDGMTLCVTTGFTDLEDLLSKGKSKVEQMYSLVITDTVRVTTGEPVVFTGDAPSDADANSFFFKDDVDASAKARASSKKNKSSSTVTSSKRERSSPPPASKSNRDKEKTDMRVGAVATKNITTTRLRSERTTQVDDDSEKRRREHQKELAAKKQQEGLARFADATGNGNGVEVKQFKKYESYKRDNQLPAKIEGLEVVVDIKNSTVVIPVLGRPVPYHINTIKNASTSYEGDWSYLRINFVSPGQGVGRKDEQPFEDASAHFLRSLTLRSTNGSRYAEVSSQISNMKRELSKKEQEKKDMEDVVEQEKLIDIRSKLIYRVCFSVVYDFVSMRR